jgi:phage major head subunit gpT-like protein
MIINEQSLAMLTQAVRAQFLQGLARSQPTFQGLAMTIPSITAENVYPYLRDLGQIREWLGDRVIQNLAKGDFRIANKDFEETHAIPRKAIEDDQYGLYGMLYEQTGQNVAAFPDKTVYSYLKGGFTTLGPDGQYFFDTDHPVGRPGFEASVANFMGGAGEAWFIADTSKVYKPLIWQPRKAFNLVSFFDEKDARVFYQKEYVWGVDGRSGVGFSPFWQLCFANKNALDATAVRTTLTAMAKQVNDAGEPIDVQGDTIYVSPNLQEQANDLFNKATLATGETNTLNGRLKVVVSSRLM